MQTARGKTLTGALAGPDEPGERGGPPGPGDSRPPGDPTVQAGQVQAGQVQAGQVQAGQPGRPRRIGFLLAVAVTVFVADLVTKTIVVATLSDRQPVRLLGGLLTLRVLRNSGAAFSIGTSMTVAFTLIAVAVIVSILRTSRRLRSLPWAITLGLLLGGATGNLGDRLFRSPGPLRGYVVDWIEMPHWPVFNVADSAIVCGGILAVLLAARGIRLDGTRDRTGGSPAGAQGDGRGSRADDRLASGPDNGPRQRTPDATLARDRPAPGAAAGGSIT
jgi:signal peptidase II